MIGEWPNVKWLVFLLGSRDFIEGRDRTIITLRVLARFIIFLLGAEQETDDKDKAVLWA